MVFYPRRSDLSGTGTKITPARIPELIGTEFLPFGPEQ